MLGNLGKLWPLFMGGGWVAAGGIYGLSTYKNPYAKHIMKWENDEKCSWLAKNDIDGWEEIPKEECSKLIKKVIKEDPLQKKFFYWVSSDYSNLKNVLLWTLLIKKEHLKEDKVPKKWNNEALRCKEESSSWNYNKINVFCEINMEEAKGKWGELKNKNKSQEQSSSQEKAQK